MHTRSALEDRKAPEQRHRYNLVLQWELCREKKITMKNWRLTIQPIVYTFLRWRFTSFNTGWVLLLFLVSSSLLSFSRSDDNEVGEMQFATRHERRSKVFSSSVVSRCVQCKSHVAILRSRIKCANTEAFKNLECGSQIYFIFWNAENNELFLKFYLISIFSLFQRLKDRLEYVISENINILAFVDATARYRPIVIF